MQRCFNASNWLTKWFFASCIADKGKRAAFLQRINIAFGKVEHEEPYAQTTTGDEKDSFPTISQFIFCLQSKTNVDKFASSDEMKPSFLEPVEEKPYHVGYRDSDTPHQRPR